MLAARLVALVRKQLSKIVAETKDVKVKAIAVVTEPVLCTGRVDHLMGTLSHRWEREAKLQQQALETQARGGSTSAAYAA